MRKTNIWPPHPKKNPTKIEFEENQTREHILTGFSKNHTKIKPFGRSSRTKNISDLSG